MEGESSINEGDIVSIITMAVTSNVGMYLLHTVNHFILAHVIFSTNGSGRILAHI